MINIKISKFYILLFFFSLVCISSNLVAERKPTDLKCDYITTPLAVEKANPKLFWKLSNGQRGARQTAFQIQAASTKEALLKENPLLWDSKKQKGRQSIHIPFNGPQLKPMSKVFWRVRVWDEKDQVSEWSSPTWFKTGLMNEENWQGANWISCTRPEKSPQYPPDDIMGPWISSSQKSAGKGLFAFHLDFEMPDKRVVSAWAYWGSSTKVHSFLTVNSQFVRPHRRNKTLLRGDYSFILKKGKNQLKMEFFKNADKDLSLTFGMHIIFDDGTKTFIRSSEKWEYICEGKQTDTKISCEYGQPPFNKATIYHIKPLAAAWYKRKFHVTKKIESAMLYVSSAGYFESYVNGQKAGDHVLDPGQSDYEEFGYYQAFDVTKNLKQNANILSILLGDGWYNQDRGFVNDRLRYGKPGLRAVLYIKYNDGTEKWVRTDKNWNWKESEIRMANIYLGEHIDFRLKNEEWASTDSQPGWEKVKIIKPISPKLIAQDFEPIRKIRTLKPVKIWQTGKKTWTADFGQNISGWVRLRFKEKKDTVIRMRCTERLTLDKKYLDNIPLSFWWCHGAPQHHILIADGKEHTWEPRFTYHGFQYAEVHGLSRAPDPDDFIAVDVHTDTPLAAQFNSSDPMLNRIFQMGIQTHYNNMHSILEDCPQREKCQWGGDLHTSWATGFYGLDSAPFYRQQIRVYYTGNQSKLGIPGNIGVGKRITTTINDFSWGISPLFLTWWMYQVYGDLEPARVYFKEMKNYLQYFEKNSPNLIPHLHKHSDHSRPIDIKSTEQNKPLIAALNYYAGADRFFKLASALGRKEDAQWGAGLAARIKKSIMEKYYDKKNYTFGNGTQDSLALAFKLVDDEEEQHLKKSLANVYTANGKKFDGGFMSYWIYPMLTRHGYVDLAYEMLINPDYPGIAWSIKEHDATTILERYYYDWDVMEDRSWDHHAMNHPTGWMLTDLAGIRFNETKPGFQNFVLMPHVPKALKYVNASVTTLYGQIKSSWKKNKDEWEWNITVPANTTAMVYIPVQGQEKIWETGKIVDKSPGLTYIDIKNNRKIYKADSGIYKFIVK